LFVKGLRVFASFCFFGFSRQIQSVFLDFWGYMPLNVYF